MHTIKLQPLRHGDVTTTFLFTEEAPMTNGGPHPAPRKTPAAKKAAKQKDQKASLKRKNLLPAATNGDKGR